MYRCIKSFEADLYDDDGFVIKCNETLIERGTLWEIDNDGVNITDSEIRLIDTQEYAWSWIEMSKEYFEEYFEKVNS